METEMHERTKDVCRKLLKEKMDELARLDVFRKNSLNDSKNASSAMESRYDTFREEAQYLAGGYARQQKILTHIIDSIKRFLEDPHNTSKHAVLGSWVVLYNLDTEEEKQYILAPNGVGGSKFKDGKDIVFVIGITTPIAKNLLLKEVGETIKLSLKNIISEWEILEIK